MDVTSKKKVKPLDLKGKSVGGVLLQGGADLRVLITGKRLQLVESELKQGLFHPRHNHPEHESIGYVINGRLQMGIGEQEYILETGDSWHHCIGVYHWSRALEDTHTVEIHSPPRPEFSTDCKEEKG